VYHAINNLYTELKCEGSPLDCHMRLVFGELLSERDLDFDFEGSTYNLLQKNGYIGQQADIMTILMSGFLGRATDMTYMAEVTEPRARILLVMQEFNTFIRLSTTNMGEFCIEENYPDWVVSLVSEIYARVFPTASELSTGQKFALFCLAAMMVSVPIAQAIRPFQNLHPPQPNDPLPSHPVTHYGVAMQAEQGTDTCTPSTITTASGDTLYQLWQQYGQGIEYQVFQDRVLGANPEAFNSRDPNQLYANVPLEINPCTEPTPTTGDSPLGSATEPNRYYESTASFHVGGIGLLLDDPLAGESLNTYFIHELTIATVEAIREYLGENESSTLDYDDFQTNLVLELTGNPIMLDEKTHEEIVNSIVKALQKTNGTVPLHREELDRIMNGTSIAPSDKRFLRQYLELMYQIRIFGGESPVSAREELQKIFDAVSPIYVQQWEVTKKKIVSGTFAAGLFIVFLFGLYRNRKK
ncbi:hypothetical protein KC573_01980, partial [candidate division WWE3 bacterium]|nr:hypothetical protein [candidate division WWE3 bacterium]